MKALHFCRRHSEKRVCRVANSLCPSRPDASQLGIPPQAASRPHKAPALTGSAFCLLALLSGVGCAPAHREGPALAAYIPPGTDAVAYADLGRLRNTAIYAKLPIPEQLRDASAVIAILKGGDWAVAGQGNFRQVPAGATLIAPDVAAAGSPDLLRAMAKKPDGGTDLLSHTPRDVPVWLVALGRATLPVTGNLGNLNRLLHQAEYTAIGLRISNRVEVDAAAQCATEAQARHLEENLRALGSLARVEAFSVTREDAAVHVTAALPIESLPELR